MWAFNSHDRFFKSPFADVAPRADYVGKQINGKIDGYFARTRRPTRFNDKNRSSSM